MTPLQEWFARETKRLIPHPEACVSEFRGAFQELRGQIGNPTGLSHALACHRKTQQLLGPALYAAQREAEVCQIDFDQHFDWLGELAAVKGAQAERSRGPSRVSDGWTSGPAAPVLGEADRHSWGQAVRKSVLGDGPSEWLVVKLVGSRESLLQYLREGGARRLEVRCGPNLTQVWEYDELGNVLWFVTAQHPDSQP